MPASCVTVSSGIGFRPINGSVERRYASDLSPASSDSSNDERSNLPYYHQSIAMARGQFLPVDPPVGLTPASVMLPHSGELSPYKPPHPTPQDSRNASVRPIETSPPRNRRRRSRTIYTSRQIRGLEACFKLNRYPGIETRENLANMIGMNEARVQVWFQNRRARLRRQERNSRRKENDQEAGAKDETKETPCNDVCQSDDITGSDDASGAPNEDSQERTATASKEKEDEQDEIDVVGLTEQEDSSSSSSSPSRDVTVTSNVSAPSLIGSPLVSISPPQICTKPCCCPPLMLPQYPGFVHQQRIPHSFQMSYHPAFHSSMTGTPPMPLWNTPPFLYRLPPSSLALQVPHLSRNSAPMGLMA